MADYKDGDEMVFDIPASGFKYRHGCSIDFGGSVLKMVYTTTSGDNISLHCVSFTRDRFDDALQYLKGKAGKALSENTAIDVCGVSCHKHRDHIKEVLGVDINIKSELDGFTSAFVYLTKLLPLEKLVFPESPEVQTYVAKYMSSMEKALASIQGIQTKQEDWQMSDPPKSEDNSSSSSSESSSSSSESEGEEKSKAKKERRRVRKQRRRERRERRRKRREAANKDGSVINKGGSAKKDNVDEKEGRADKTSSKKTYSYVKYPTFLLMCGSAGSPIKIHADGTFQPVDVNIICGRFFLGLGGLLTGAKSFGELVELCKSGNHEALNVMGKHLVDKEDSTDFYSALPGEMITYGMGHAVGRDIDSYKREDLAAATLTTVALSLAQVFQIYSMLLNIPQGFFCGSFTTNSQVIREEISKHFTVRSAANPYGKPTEHYFIRCGAYLGCIGCMFMTMNPMP